MKDDLWKNNNNPMNRTLSVFPDKTNGNGSNIAAAETQTPSNSNDSNNNNTSISSSEFTTRASFELPLQWNVDTGALEVEKHIRSTVICRIPPTAGKGVWSATMKGSTLVRGPMGSATGSLAVDCKLAERVQLNGGINLGDQARTSIGGVVRTRTTITNNKSSSKAPSTFAANLYSMPYENRTGMNLSSHQTWDFSSSPMGSTFTTKLSLDCPSLSSFRSSKATMSVRSLSPHKAELGIDWAVEGNRPQFRLGFHPKLSRHRNGGFTCSFGLPGSHSVWRFGAVLNQSLASKVASLGLGVSHSKSRGLCWLFCWNRGDVTVRVPIYFNTHKLTSASTSSSALVAMMYPLQVLYLSMLSRVIQDAIADLWKLTPNDDLMEEKQQQWNAKERRLLLRSKARSDAEQQKQLMLRQATSRNNAEKETTGLVIVEALYSVTGGDEWDVTTQLQFWITRSTLELPSSSKQDLLGFYDVTTSLANLDEEPLQSQQTQSKWRRWMFWNVFESIGAGKKELAPVPVPTLIVRYIFCNVEYEITVNDDEALLLPNPNAIVIQ